VDLLFKIPMTFYTGRFPPHTLGSRPEKQARGGFMHRSGTGVFIVVLAILLTACLTGCVGSNSGGNGGGGVKTVTLSPSGTQSINVGATQIFTATATDTLGQAVVAGTIQFTVTSGNSNPAPLSITSAGAACAGSWDSTGTICSPGVPGIALVTATVNGVSSTQTTVYVHQHIDSIQVSRLDPQGPPQHDCFSQGQTWNYQAIAYDISQHDITNTIGPVVWSSSNADVLTVDNITGLQNNQTQVTAKTPGVTQLFANVAGTTSAPIPFTTCLVKYVRLQIQGGSGNSFSINNGGSTTIQAAVVDTVDATLRNPPLTWSSSNPEVASFSTASNTTGSNSITARTNQGATDISAACTPPTCNIGVLPGLPIYSSGGNLPNGNPGYGVISANITATKPPTYTAWAATTDCGTGAGCSSVTFAVTPGTTPIGASASLPRTPNSMMFNEQGARIYFGSDQGLMYLDAGASSPTVAAVSAAPTPCHVSLCGTVLAISPDGNRVLVSDTVSNPHQIYIFNAASSSTAPVDLVLPNPSDNPTAAAFSPDGMKVFILTDTGTLYVYSSVDAMASVPIAVSATDVAFSADGSFAYLAGTPASSVSGFATCDLSDIGSVGLPSTPLKIVPAPEVQEVVINPSQSIVTQNVIALEPPNIQTLAAKYIAGAPLNDGIFTCNAPTFYPDVTGFSAGPTINLGQGNFVPLYMRVVGNGSQVIVVGKNIPAVLVVNVTQQTTTPIALVNNGLPRAASASTDGSQVFVAACDAFTNNDPTLPCTSGSVHIINILSGGDFQQVPYVNINTNNSMCNQPNAPPCFPNLIAIKPQ
jgi:hypothetical protein